MEMKEEEREQKGKGRSGENCNIRQGVLPLHADICPKSEKSCYSSVCLRPLFGSKGGEEEQRSLRQADMQRKVD